MTRLAPWLAGLLLGLVAGLAAAAPGCRIAYDLGSSGIRAGQSGHSELVWADIDYLKVLAAGHGLGETLPATASALRDLPERGHFAADCPRVGGGFSAWRIAAGQNRQQLATDLAALKKNSGVAVLVIPQRQEGAYGYLGARQALGPQLTTDSILDIGGGSLQIAGPHRGWGAPFGQKLWHRELCQVLRGTDRIPCALHPLSPAELAQARQLAQQRLSGITRTLPDGAEMTAISRPVTRGVAPAVASFLNRPRDLAVLSPTMLRATLEQNAGLDLPTMAARLGSQDKHAAYLISDLLLVEGLLRATGNHDLHVAEIDLTNIPGLLADDRAYRWAARYGCYLERLRRQGVDAYASDPTTCPTSAPDR